VLQYLVGMAVLRGDPASASPYIASLPEPPETINLWSKEQQVLGEAMLGRNHLSMYKPLVSAITNAAANGCKGKFDAVKQPPPTEQEVFDSFHFILSRLSHMRLIPVADLANAAAPGEATARIMADGKICAIIAKGEVRKGQELLIDYNHRDAITLLASYGFTGGLEHERSMTRLKFDAGPALLRATGSASARYASEGVQLLDEEEAGLHADAFLCARWQQMNEHELALALNYGWDSGTNSKIDPAVQSVLAKAETRGCQALQATCKVAMDVVHEWEDLADRLPGVAWITAALRAQVATDRRLLERVSRRAQKRIDALQKRAVI